MKQDYLSNEIETEGGALSCDEVCELLYLFICDELDENEAKQVSAHLFGCATCRTALAETVRVAGSLSQSLHRIPQKYYSRNN